MLRPVTPSPSKPWLQPQNWHVNMSTIALKCSVASIPRYMNSACLFESYLKKIPVLPPEIHLHPKELSACPTAVCSKNSASIFSRVSGSCPGHKIPLFLPPE